MPKKKDPRIRTGLGTSLGATSSRATEQHCVLRSMISSTPSMRRETMTEMNKMVLTIYSQSVLRRLLLMTLLARKKTTMTQQ
jgi:hypothetical protein